MVLSVLSIWSSKSAVTSSSSKSPEIQKGGDEMPDVAVELVAVEQEVNVPKDDVHALGASSPIGLEQASNAPVDTTDPGLTVTEPSSRPIELEHKPNPGQPRFSFRSLGFFYGSRGMLTHDQDALERQKASNAAKRESLSILSRSADRRAQRNAIAVQRLIVGTSTIESSNTKARPVSHMQLTRIKSELMKPKSANRLIAKLRELPPPDSYNDGDERKLFRASATVPKPSTIPIHAVCLESTEDDVQEKFSKLDGRSVISSSIDALTSFFNDLHIVDLLAAPDLGFGQPADGKGILAGAVPTAETVIEGAAKLTPQLMALGYATGKAVFPDHTSIHPPTDRLSVLTYWWGLELCLPPPTLAHLAQAPDIAHQVINFLSALSLMNDGVREVLPFVRYIGQFVDFEWGAIKKQDKGRGVVCAATWIMPAAMVPRPWDFPDAPPVKIPNPPAGANPDTGDGPHSGPDAVKDIILPPNHPVPIVLVTPPSVIKNAPVSQETAAS